MKIRLTAVFFHGNVRKKKKKSFGPEKMVAVAIFSKMLEIITWTFIVPEKTYTKEPTFLFWPCLLLSS